MSLRDERDPECLSEAAEMPSHRYTRRYLLQTLASAVLPWATDDVHTPYVPRVLALGFLSPFCLGLFQEPGGGGFRAAPELCGERAAAGQ